MSAAKGTSARPKASDEPAARPMLLFFFEQTSGPCRRAEGYLAQVLQRRSNHDTFAIHFVGDENDPDAPQV